ncbi:helix-turn-helix domain-containing protein [Fusobacterium gastrosuis]|uniref:helix-turn-helix domain-containing protein n=1 Tax=Fusobacterium gastrosuis TaxID=1755100 RepID=UPI002975577F|nr:helix-turn-helix domain-containing protein [Fusobacteriaceae bacterium]MDY5712353.1 helix-turn-helix domain-containing protein [Fusobacterium gastrosuis]
MKIDQLRAKKLYANGKNPLEIAEELGISKGTVYRWIKDNKKEFEEARELARLTLDDVVDLLDETHKKILIEISKNPQKFQDPKIADSLVKVANVVEKVCLRSEKKKEQAKKEEEEERGVVFVDDIK